MQRRPIRWMLLSLFFTPWLAAAGAADSTATKPNIILVMADDQGWGDMAYNGHPVVKTPNFDEAAATGLRFDRFYAAAPVCSPTRASVLTGRHPNRSGVFQWGFPLRPQETTIAEALKTAGYTTGHFGKWHLGSVRSGSPANPGAHGFDEWFSAPNFYDNDAIMSHRGKAVKTVGESSAIAVDAAMQWIDDVRKKPEPFLAVVWFGSPHVPHQAAPEDSALYKDQNKRMREFLGEVTGMDRAFGKLRDGLGERGLRENTILWYCSDNGALPRVGSSGGHRGLKAEVYEGGLLVPAILEWPTKIDHPRTTSVRCNTTDIYPTLLDVAGVEMENQPIVDGISLLPLIEEKATERSKPMGFWNYAIRGIITPSAVWMGELYEAQQAGDDLPPDPVSANAATIPTEPVVHALGHSAWIDGDWKLHRIEEKGKATFELYDLATDPKEEKDLFAKQSKSPRVAEMQQALEAWLNSVDASYLGKDY
ncbi:Arylsulfatase precursor [Rosistilla ulvae]|uniref:Arylsulfatase n=1 Tax=Rosistilla ulvae TaxID=1930277 RepID=A0A517LZZ8_9BACT|nr:sulfatase-like hydrolase/transferase [Rosistilla ulvae]QDS88192.1 Arylsulfatase precursor [Rosistilla ulvae]